MSDLDEDELKATRRLNGADKPVDFDGVKVGEYVRTKEGRIIKLENDEEFYEESVDIGVGIMPAVNGIWIDKEYVDYIEKANIAKHSPNLIDLIEVDDYVNGEKVIEVDSFKNWIDIGDEVIREEDIKTIVTHEQFNSVAYKVEV